MKRVSVGKLYEFACKALMYYGMNAGDAEVTARTLVTTDTFGVLSHGTKNLCQYIQKIQAGGIDPKAKPAILRKGRPGPSWMANAPWAWSQPAGAWNWPLKRPGRRA